MILTTVRYQSVSVHTSNHSFQNLRSISGFEDKLIFNRVYARDQDGMLKVLYIRSRTKILYRMCQKLQHYRNHRWLKRNDWKTSLYKHYLENQEKYFSESGYPHGHKLYLKPKGTWKGKVRAKLITIRNLV